VALVPDSAPADGSPDWLGVCGKTQIAAMIAESLWRSRAVDALIWIAATSQASVLSALVQASVAATGREPAGTAESVVTRFVSWLGETSQPWLVVLDDLQEATYLDGAWPAGPAGRLLVTSRQPAIATGWRGTQVIPVGFFSVHEALDCLTERLSANPIQHLGAIDLVETLGREPLALGQASAVIASSNLNCLGYRDLFVRRRQEIQIPAREMPSAAMTWTLSLARAESLLPGTSVTLMLALVALLDGHGIPGAIFRTSAAAAYLGGAAAPFSAVTDPQPAWDTLLALEQAGLISVDRTVTPPAVLISPAVPAAIRLAAPAEAQEPAARAAAGALLEAWPADEPGSLDRRPPAGERGQPARIGRRCAMDRRMPSAATAGRPEPRRGPSGRAGPGLLAGPGRSLRHQAGTRPRGRPVRSRPAGRRVLGGRVRRRGRAVVPAGAGRAGSRARARAPRHRGAARAGLAQALIMAGQPADAVSILLRAVSEGEQHHGPGHPDTLSAREGLAAAYQATGDVVAASRLLARSLADRERLHGPRDARTMAVRDRLAAACLAEGKVRDAISHYKQVLGDRRKVLGRDHPDTLATSASLAAASQAAGRMPAAMQLFGQCCADSERVLGPDHPDTLTRMANLAHLYYAVGLMEDAEALLRRTAARCERVLPPADPLAQAVRQSLASIEEA
jgi:hypothetical protein